MGTFIAFLVGVVVGGVVMYFVYRNNTKKFEGIEAELKAKIDSLS